jgi:hypothetical protein
MSSISIATGGMFNDCCGVGVAGGGAPPVHQYAEQYEKRLIDVKVLKVYFDDLKKEDKKLKVLIKNIRLNGF